MSGAAAAMRAHLQSVERKFSSSPIRSWAISSGPSRTAARALAVCSFRIVPVAGSTSFNTTPYPQRSAKMLQNLFGLVALEQNAIEYVVMELKTADRPQIHVDHLNIGIEPSHVVMPGK